MAFLQVNLLSQKMMGNVSVNVILPADKISFPGMPVREEKPYKTLYLLHGVFGNYMDWSLNSMIARYADEHNLAVVMPAGENDFYVDHPSSGKMYGSYIGEELVEITRKMFPLSRKREDTFIGGLSMGGYGALRNGLKYHDTFGSIVALSSALWIKEMHTWPEESPMPFSTRRFAQECFGDLDQVLESDKNPEYLIRQLKASGADIPNIYMACGKDDPLLAQNEDFHSFLMQNNVDCTYVTAPGNHEWDFWNSQIQAAIDWLPTEKPFMGMDSGHVF